MDQPLQSPDFPGCSLCGQGWIQSCWAFLGSGHVRAPGMELGSSLLPARGCRTLESKETFRSPPFLCFLFTGIKGQGGKGEKQQVLSLRNSTKNAQLWHPNHPSSKAQGVSLLWSSTEAPQ